MILDTLTLPLCLVKFFPQSAVNICFPPRQFDFKSYNEVVLLINTSKTHTYIDTHTFQASQYWIIMKLNLLKLYLYCLWYITVTRLNVAQSFLISHFTVAVFIGYPIRYAHPTCSGARGPLCCLHKTFSSPNKWEIPIS